MPGAPVSDRGGAVVVPYPVDVRPDGAHADRRDDGRTDGPGSVSIGYEPIVDVARGVVAGYQTRARFPAADVPRSLDVAASSALGNDAGGRLTAMVAARALAMMASLPVNTFLTIPLGVDVAASPAVRRVLLGDQSLGGLILDVAGPIGSPPAAELVGALEGYRAAGALIAVGGYGAAQPELTSIVRLAPSVLRLGRDWIRGIDRSKAKRSAVEVIGHLAGQLDAWILAEGVSSSAELRVLSALRVPLAQGPFVGAAKPHWTELEAGVRTVLPRNTEMLAPGAGALAALVQQAYTATDAAAAAAVLPEASGFDVVVIVDDHGRPVTLLEHGSATWDASPVLAVNVDTDVSDVVQRAMTRPRMTRFTPLVATDDTGRFLGILRIERLMSHLAVAPGVPA